MRIVCLVKPNSSKEKIEKTGENQFIIWVHVPPIENKANLKVQKLLSDHFNIPKNSVVLFKGGKSKRKIFDIYV
jgi:uncharacterized protein YggU (UPF0235/DUF167 family)